MATFTAVNPIGPTRFDLFNVTQLLAGSTITGSGTTFTRGADPDNATTFQGSGFTYSGGLFNGGTIDSISSVAGGQILFTIAGLALPVAQFRSFASAGNSQGFLAAIFASDDTLTGSAFADLLRGYAGNDKLSGGGNNDTLDGGVGVDTMDGADGDDLYIVDNTGDVILDSSGFDTVKSSAASYDLAGGAERLILMGKGNLNGGGDNLANQIFGTIGANLLMGRDGNDLLDGGAGNDSLDGGGQNDTLLGGIGIDTMTGGDGDDLFFVDNAKEALSDSSGIDSAHSTVSFVLGADIEHLFLLGNGALNGTGNGAGNQIVGLGGANKLLGLGANDFLDGAGGNDTLDGGTGDDTMIGGGGNDTYFVDSNSDQLFESIGGKAGGIDTVFSSAGVIVLGANIENVTLVGANALQVDGNELNNLIISKSTSLAANLLSGGAGNDTIIGADAGDTVTGGAGADVMSGGKGDDQYFVAEAGDKVIESIAGPDGGIDTVHYAGAGGYVLGKNVETLRLQGSAVSGTGNALENAIFGNDLANLLDGKAGVDFLFGGKGDDTYIVDNTVESIDELTGDGIDVVKSTVSFSLSGPTVVGAVENLILQGKALTGTGNDLNNQITGNGGNNTLFGLNGDDTLDGGAGNDALGGSSGNDVYIVDSKLDQVNEGGATDTGDTVISSKISLDLSLAAYADIENIGLLGKAALTGTGNGGGNIITGNDGANKLFGLDGSDTLVGGNGNDTLDGGIGLDTLQGGSGNDTYVVDEENTVIGDVIVESVDGGIDTVISSASFFILKGNAENLTLAPGAGDINGVSINSLGNVIFGNEGKNNIFGGGGNDTIDGGAGDDVLFGGVGDDVIIVSSGNDTVGYLLNAGHETIKGFDGNPLSGQDVLDLDGLFDSIPVDTADRAARVMLVDYGATVDVRVDVDGNLDNGYEQTVATLQTKDAVSIGEDVLVGTL
jgi:trimeric autotransporter adhesin